TNRRTDEPTNRQTDEPPNSRTTKPPTGNRNRRTGTLGTGTRNRCRLPSLDAVFAALVDEENIDTRMNGLVAAMHLQ
ncbi:MAG: hypothetical protein EHM55_02490, partial [Acidobacteria bacterium]